MELSMTPIKSYWHACDNFGDALTPYLIEKISGEKPDYVAINSDPSLIMVTGSILGCSVHCGIIWGNGCAFESDLDPACFAPPSEDFKILATRGRLSKEIIEKSGHKPLACGDPGILLPSIYTPIVEKKYKVGIICSWVDYDEVKEQYTDEDTIVINSMGGVEDIINRIYECEALISSTLHGFVAGVAYRLPSLLVKFSDRMIGDGFKYRDFYTCLDRPFNMLDLRGTVIDTNELVKQSHVHNLTVNVQDLIDCCPFKRSQ